MGLIRILKGEQPGLITTLLNYKNAGQFGEFSIEYALKNDNIYGEYIVMKNAYIPMQGKHTEVDIILLHEKGIFVFESKNYSGSIFGKLKDLNWVQILSNNNKYAFYNPIKQNETHIFALAKFLKLPKKAFTSYVVFSQRCKLKEVPKSTDKIIILRINKMLKHLRKVLKERETIYTTEQLKGFEKKLRPCTKVSKKVKKAHVKRITKKYQTKKCPLCGKQLVKRTGMHGDFMGCKGYPKCRYTREIAK